MGKIEIEILPIYNPKMAYDMKLHKNQKIKDHISIEFKL